MKKRKMKGLFYKDFCYIKESKFLLVFLVVFGFGFSYAGKRYQFFTFGKSKEALATLHDTIEHSDKVSDLKA